MKKVISIILSMAIILTALPCEALAKNYENPKKIADVYKKFEQFKQNLGADLKLKSEENLTQTLQNISSIKSELNCTPVPSKEAKVTQTPGTSKTYTNILTKNQSITSLFVSPLTIMPTPSSIEKTFSMSENSLNDSILSPTTTNIQPDIPTQTLESASEFDFDTSTGTLKAYHGKGGNIIIPNQINGVIVKNIGYEAFYDCSSLTSITIPDSVTTLGDRAFSDCSSLTGITTPDSVTTIGYEAFYNCSSLKSITIPASVTTIGDGAFYSCSSLTSITIPASVTTIGYAVFYYCSSLTSITIPDSVTTICYGAFSNCSRLTSITIPDSVTTIGGETFSCCSRLTSITIPDSVTAIGDYAFYYCSSLTSITIADSVTAIGDKAFSNCSSLTSITIPDSVTTIGDNAFDYCSRLTSITIPASVTTIGDYAFCYCSSLTSIIIPASVTTIGDEAFSYCSRLTSITIPDSVKAIGEKAFTGCDILTITTPMYSYAYIYAMSNNIPVKKNINVYMRIIIPITNNKNLYNSMVLSLINTSKNTKHSVNITNASQYTFGGVIPGDIYRATITNKYGNIINQIDNIIPTNGTSEVAFTTTPETKTVKVTVKDIDGNELKTDITVNWYDENNSFLLQGDSISHIQTGMKLYYDILLDKTLGSQYILPVRQNYTVVDGDNNLTFTLEPIPIITLSGEVKDKSDNTPIANAIVSISQMLNGKYPKTIIAYSDNKGQFTAQAFNDSTNISVSKDNYINSGITNIHSNFTGSGYNLGEIKMTRTTGAQIKLKMTYIKSTEAGGTQTKSSAYLDMTNTNFTLYNETQGRAIDRYSVQFNNIVLLENANIGDVIKLTATSKNDDCKPITTTLALDSDLKATARLDFVQNGSFKATNITGSNNDNVAILYDSNGKYVSTIDIHSTAVASSTLPEGNYSVLFIAKSLFLNNIQSLSDYTSSGLVENTDYCKKAIKISAGLISVIDNILIPRLDESKLYYTENSSTTFTANTADSGIGSFFTLRASYMIKSSLRNDVTNMKLVFNLPDNCQLVSGSVRVGNTLYSNYISNGNTVIIPVSNSSDIARCSVLPYKEGNYAINAFLEFDINGVNIKQPIGVVKISAKVKSINLPERTAQTVVTINGTSFPGSDITIYDNNIAVGQTKALKNGCWSIDVELYKPYNFSYHDIYAEMHTQNGLKEISETKKVVYDKNYINASKVTMINTAHGSNSLALLEYNTVIDFINPSSKSPVYWYWPSYPTFTFKVEFTKNDPGLIRNVVINVFTSSGKVFSLPAVYDKKNCFWITKGDFDTYNLPINVSVSFDCLTKVNEINAQQMEDMKEELSSLAFEKDMDDYLNEVTKDLKSRFNISLDYNSENSKYTYHADEIGDYSATIKDCSGLNKEGLLDEGFTLFNTTDGNAIYFKQNNDSYALVNFKENAFIEFKNDIAIRWAYGVKSGGSSGIMELLKTYDKVNSCIDYMKNQLEQIEVSLEKAAQTIEENVKGLGDDNPSKIFWLKRAAQFRAVERFLKYSNVMCSIYNAVDVTIQLNTLISLYNQLPDCPGAEQLKSEIVYTGVCLGTYAITKIANLCLSITALFAAPTTGGITGIPAVTLIFLGYLADLLAGEIFEARIEEYKSRAKEIKCTPTPSPSLPPLPPGPNVRYVLDPSGYVFEAVSSNRLQGVTTTIFYKGNKNDTTATLWDAAEYQQNNPLISDIDGKYAWDVPQGWWQVKYEKSGYQTAYSEWLPVPPPQFDINIGMISYSQPNIVHTYGYNGYIEIAFDKYVQASTLTTDNISVLCNGKSIAGKIQLMNSEASPLNPSELYATKLRFIPSDYQFMSSDNVQLTVGKNVQSYADVSMNSDFKSSISIQIEPKTLVATDILNISYGDIGYINIEVMPKEASAGKKINAISAAPSLVTVAEETVLDEAGKAKIPVNANLAGASIITVSLNGTDLQAQTKVNVAMPIEKSKKDVFPADANQLINDRELSGRLVILDVRTSREFEVGHITGALNIDYNSPIFSQEVGPLDKAKTYLVYCASGNRSSKAADMMIALGFDNVYNMVGGLTAWESAGYPVEDLATPTQTAIATSTPMQTNTYTPTVTPEITKMPTPINSVTPTNTQTSVPNNTMTPTATPTVTNTFTPANTITPTATNIPGSNNLSNQIVITPASTNTEIGTPTPSATIRPTDQVKVIEIPDKEVPGGKLFPDAINHWSKEYIDLLYSKGIINGYPDGTIKPDNEINRAEVAIILAKAIGIESQIENASIFKDISDAPKASIKYINALAEKGILKGYEDSSFRPDNKITRAELVAMVMRAFNIKTENNTPYQFSDVKSIPAWASDYISAAMKSGILNGYPDGTFKPFNSIKRAEVFSIIAKCRH